MKKVYICNDNITGIFSAVYDAWKDGRDEENAGIMLRGTLEQQLFCEYVEVEERPRKVIAVEKLIKKHLGHDAYWDIYHAVLSQAPEKGDAVLGTMFAARKIGDSTKIMEHLSHPKVRRVFELSRKVANEAHFFVEFIRFRELANGVMFSEITPKSQVLTCIADHFSDRFPLENWMVYDRTHHMFLVHQAKKQWVLVLDEEPDEEMIGEVSAAQKEYEQLWKVFFHSISIVERENPTLQKNNLPLHFRQNMLEFDS